MHYIQTHEIAHYRYFLKSNYAELEGNQEAVMDSIGGKILKLILKKREDCVHGIGKVNCSGSGNIFYQDSNWEKLLDFSWSQEAFSWQGGPGSSFGDVSMTNIFRVELANLCGPHCNNTDIELYCSPF